MQASEIRELNDREIQDRIEELQEERFRLRLRAATQPLEQPMRLREVRRDIARLKTVLTERQTGSTGSKGSTWSTETAKGESPAPTRKRATARSGR